VTSPVFFPPTSFGITLGAFEERTGALAPAGAKTTPALVDSAMLLANFSSMA
jgi:hypothetical protein